MEKQTACLVDRLALAVQRRGDRDSETYLHRIRTCIDTNDKLIKTDVWRQLGWGIARGQRVDKRVRRLMDREFSDWSDTIPTYTAVGARSDTGVFVERPGGRSGLFQHVQNHGLELSGRVLHWTPDLDISAEQLRALIGAAIRGTYPAAWENAGTADPWTSVEFFEIALHRINQMRHRGVHGEDLKRAATLIDHAFSALDPNLSPPVSECSGKHPPASLVNVHHSFMPDSPVPDRGRGWVMGPMW